MPSKICHLNLHFCVPCNPNFVNEFFLKITLVLSHDNVTEYLVLGDCLQKGGQDAEVNTVILQGEFKMIPRAVSGPVG